MSISSLFLKQINESDSGVAGLTLGADPLVSGVVILAAQSGIDLNGNQGKSMFSTNSMVPVANPYNKSKLDFEVVIGNPNKIIQENITAKFIKSTNSWEVNSSKGISIAQGNKLSFDGVEVQIIGNPVDGDIVEISPNNTRAGAFRFNFTSANDFAAASKNLISASAQNVGSVELKLLGKTALIQDKFLPPKIDEVFTRSSNPLLATSFLKDGVVSSIPGSVKSINLNSLNDIIDKNSSFIDFKEKIQSNLSNSKTSIIAEIKKASPSAGIIIENYNPVEIADIYNSNNVTCLSVLTEEDYFLGNLIHISKIKEKINLPILCKDFFIDKFQIPLAKSYGADAILIILAGVSDNLANDLYEEALKYKMSVIVEVHTVDEAKKALNFKEALIGINNRNLKTLKTDINTTYDIHNVLINHDGPLISESGIKTKEELLDLKDKTSINTFLIGESLLKNLDKNSIFSVL